MEHRLPHNVVLGVGPLDSDVAIFGEAPADQEFIEGEPFVGMAGETLGKILTRVGLLRQLCRIDNVVQRKLPGDKMDFLYKDKKHTKPTEELWQWFEHCWKRVNELDANVIIAAGELALRCMVDTGFEDGGKKIGAWRGSIVEGRPEIKGRKVIPIYHPQYVNYQAAGYPILLADMKRASKQSEFPEIRTPHRNLVVAQNEENIKNLVEGCEKASMICLDIETRRGQIACVGFAVNETWAMTIPLTTTKGRYWENLNEEAWVWAQISKILKSDTPKILQNSLYDAMWLSRHGFQIKNVYYDTMLMMGVAYPEMSKGLDFLVSLFTEWPYYKDEIKDWTKIDDEVLWEYNAKDCCCTYEVCLALIEELKLKGLYDFYRNHTHQLLSPAFKSMSRGFTVDLDLKREMVVDFENRVTQLSAQLINESGKAINVRSPKQMKHWLFEDLGFKPILKKRFPDNRRGCTH